MYDGVLKCFSAPSDCELSMWRCGHDSSVMNVGDKNVTLKPLVAQCQHCYDHTCDVVLKSLSLLNYHFEVVPLDMRECELYGALFFSCCTCGSPRFSLSLSLSLSLPPSFPFSLSTIQYLGFGLSGSTSLTLMFRADATIAWVDENGIAQAQDYYLSNYVQVRTVNLK